MVDTVGDVSMTSLRAASASSLEKQLIIGATVGLTCCVVWALVVFAILVARHSAKKERQRHEEARRRSSSRSGRMHGDSRQGEYRTGSNFHHLAFTSRTFTNERGIDNIGPGLGPSMLPLHSYHEPFLGRRADNISISGVTSVASSNRSGRPAIVPFRASNLPQTEDVHYDLDGRLQSHRPRQYHPDNDSRDHSDNHERRYKRNVAFDKVHNSYFAQQSSRTKKHSPKRKTPSYTRNLSSSSSSNQDIYEMKSKQSFEYSRESSREDSLPHTGASSPRPQSPEREGFSWTVRTIHDPIPETSTSHLWRSPVSGFVPEVSASISQDEASMTFDEEPEHVWVPRHPQPGRNQSIDSSLGGFSNEVLSCGSSSSSSSERRRRSNIPSFVAAEYDRIFESNFMPTTHRNGSSAQPAYHTPDVQLPDSGYYDDVFRKSSVDR